MIPLFICVFGLAVEFTKFFGSSVFFFLFVGCDSPGNFRVDCSHSGPLNRQHGGLSELVLLFPFSSHHD